MDLMTQPPQAATPLKVPGRSQEKVGAKQEDPETPQVSFTSILQETQQPAHPGKTLGLWQGTKKIVSPNGSQQGSINTSRGSCSLDASPVVAQLLTLEDKPSVLDLGAVVEHKETTPTPKQGPILPTLQQAQPATTSANGTVQELEAPAGILKTPLMAKAVSRVVESSPTAEIVEGEAAEFLTGEKVQTAKLQITAKPTVDISSATNSKEPESAMVAKVEPRLPGQPVSENSKEIPAKSLNSEATPAEATVASIKDEGKEEHAQDSEMIEESPEIKASTPEVTSLVRPNSAEVEQLAAQSNAQKVYQQPIASAEHGVSPNSTLADLDMDSGSLDSKEQKQESIARILTSASSTLASKTSIRGQVLTQVVQHLKDEMGHEKLTIRLNPEKLGQVEIQFQTRGDSLNIVMSASSHEAESVLKEGTRELAENIADKSPRWNLVDVRIENRGQDQSKQESRQNERREKQDQETQQQRQGRQDKNKHKNSTGAGEWAAFHLGG